MQHIPGECRGTSKGRTVALISCRIVLRVKLAGVARWGSVGRASGIGDREGKVG